MKRTSTTRREFVSRLIRGTAAAVAVGGSPFPSGLVRSDPIAPEKEPRKREIRVGGLYDDDLILALFETFVSLDRFPTAWVLGEEHPDRFLERYRPGMANVILVDDIFPGMSMPQFVREIRRRDGRVRMLLLSACSLFGRPAEIADGICAGAGAVLPVPFQFEELIRSVFWLWNDEIVMHPSLASFMLGRDSAGHEAPRIRFDDVEIRALRMAANDMNLADIATGLDMSEPALRRLNFGLLERFRESSTGPVF